MKKVVLVARLLLGLMFTVFGLNGFLHFLPSPPIPGDAGILIGLLVAHQWMTVVFLLQLIGGILLLVGRFVPVGLTLLGPVIFNVLLFHIRFNPSGIVPGLIALVLEVFLIYAYRPAFAGIFNPNMEVL
jgi:putative oxidoreductase